MRVLQMGALYLALQMIMVLLTSGGPRSSNVNVISGTLVQAIAQPPVLVVLTEKKLRQVPLAKGAALSRGARGGQFSPARLADLEIGDHIWATVDSSGAAASIRASYDLVSGEVRSIQGRRILLSSGELIEMHPSAQILGMRHETILMTVIRRGDRVTVKIDPETEEGWRLILGGELKPRSESRSTQNVKAAEENKQVLSKESPRNERPVITSIDHNCVEPLRPGSVLRVIAGGTPGCQGEVEIVGVARFPMKETAPGKYEAEWTVAKGIRAVGAPVIGVLKRGTERSSRLQAPRLISIILAPADAVSAQPTRSAAKISAQPVTGSGKEEAFKFKAAKSEASGSNAALMPAIPVAGAGPPIAQGPIPAMPAAEVPSPRISILATSSSPSAPFFARPEHELSIEIVRPRPGERLIGYLIVIGRTAPGAKVKIHVDYSNNKAGLLNLSGLVAQEEVMANAAGDFSSRCIPINRSLNTPGLEFTITVEALDRTGRRSHPVVVKARGRDY